MKKTRKNQALAHDNTNLLLVDPDTHPLGVAKARGTTTQSHAESIIRAVLAQIRRSSRFIDFIRAIKEEFLDESLIEFVRAKGKGSWTSRKLFCHLVI